MGVMCTRLRSGPAPSDEISIPAAGLSHVGVDYLQIDCGQKAAGKLSGYAKSHDWGVLDAGLDHLSMLSSDRTR